MKLKNDGNVQLQTSQRSEKAMNLFVAGDQELKRLRKWRYLNLNNLKHQSVQ